MNLELSKGEAIGLCKKMKGKRAGERQGPERTKRGQARDQRR